MPDENRQISFVLSGEAIRDHKVSVGLFAKTLKAIQDTVIQIGKAKFEYESSRPGPTPSIIRTECELFFVRSDPGSLSATLELAPHEPQLFPEYERDIGAEVLEDAQKVIDSIVNDDPQELERAIPDERYRYRVVKSFSEALPREGTDYSIAFKVGTGRKYPQVVRPTRERVARLTGVKEPQVVEEEVPTVQLIDALCRVKVKSDEEPRPEDITAIVDWTPAGDSPDLRPFRPREVNWGKRILILNHEIACDVSIEDDLYVVRYEPLGIRAYADTREDAIAAFNEEFVLLWDEYGSAPEEQLTPDAIRLKGIMVDLVKGQDQR